MKKQFNLEYYLEHSGTKVETRDGHNVRIISTDFRDPEFPVVAFITREDLTEFVSCFTISGELHAEGKDDLDLFFDLPDPAKKKVALTCEDLQERIKAGKTMWIVPDNNKYAKIILGFNDAYCSIVEGINQRPAGMRFRLEEMMEYHFADGDPCWKEGGEE